MIDLHLHTTISDGRLTPGELVRRAAKVGLRVMAVTDHDTTFGTPEVRALATAAGIEAVSGIEMTAVERGKDVHILGYFVREDDPGLAEFLTQQRVRRIARVRAIANRLASLGMVVDVEPLIRDVQQREGCSIGRPQIARALIDAGHVSSFPEAFDRWLGQDRPGFVPREGPGCEEVIDILHAAGGLASLAHPGKTAIDARIPDLCRYGLDAIEVYHSDHDAALVAHYWRIATDAGVLMTGGSDYHGVPQQGREVGSCTLPEAAWNRLRGASGRG